MIEINTVIFIDILLIKVDQLIKCSLGKLKS